MGDISRQFRDIIALNAISILIPPRGNGSIHGNGISMYRNGLLTKEFFVVTDNGKYEVVVLGGNETTSRALWSYLELGHKYNVVVSMGMIVGVN